MNSFCIFMDHSSISSCLDHVESAFLFPFFFLLFSFLFFVLGMDEISWTDCNCSLILLLLTVATLSSVLIWPIDIFFCIWMLCGYSSGVLRVSIEQIG